MKKKALLLLIIILSLHKVEAKTLNNLYEDLNNLQEEKELYIYLTSDDIKELTKTSNDLNIIINTLNDEINNINNEIKTKEENIKSLEEEINNMFVFNQTSKGENIYLEYIFDTDNYSEMIYRYMIVEELSKYNNSLIEKANKEIEKLNITKEELNKKIEKLNKQRDNFKEIEKTLKRVSSNNYESIKLSLDDDITNLKKEISYYESIGCKRNIDLNACINIKDNSSLIYPLNKGCVTKDYNVGYNASHSGIDLGCNSEGNSVYASGYGIVAQIVKESTCGGNIVWIYHTLNGKEYTSIYGHLLEIKVSVGSTVTPNTVIGLLGGESTAYINGGYDKCTNGAHLHYGVAEGYHTNDYSTYLINPRYLNNYPNVLNGIFTR